MQIDLTNLPTDTEALQALVRVLAGDVKSKGLLIEQLKAQIAKLKRMQFGKSSEELDHQIAQLELQLDELHEDEADAAAKSPAALQALIKETPEKPYRKPLPDHLPLYRQSGIYAREGVELERSTLADWVGRCAALLDPLIEALRKDVLFSAVLHGDDTPVPVLAPGLGKTKTGRLWTYVRDGRPCGLDQPPAAVFFYSPDRRGEHPQSHLKNFKGILHADGYAGFNAIFERPEVTEAACWAHVRRKFFDVQEANGSPIAKEALDKIAALYAIESHVRGKPPDERQRYREGNAAPLVADLKAWLDTTLSKLSGKSELAGAMRYTLSRWKALSHYIHDGRIEIDNNAAERSIRGIALGRKNYLFAGSDTGGNRAAAIYSLIETCKLNTINPEAYLRDILARIPDHKINRIDELLPWNWQAAQNVATLAGHEPSGYHK